MMTQIEERIKPYFWAVFEVRNGIPAVCSSVPAICSGTIEQILSFSATYRVKKPAKLCYISILPQTPVNTQYNRGLFGATFEAIGGAA
ncbi:hypothetical protein QUA56_30255 [Microcoleus sp. N3A4]|uniref:hypothetical protein n=1 Tax=Microcoleus sp. N3A4 TaxID=3055379 RepID=UPI002FCF3530